MRDVAFAPAGYENLDSELWISFEEGNGRALQGRLPRRQNARGSSTDDQDWLDVLRHARTYAQQAQSPSMDSYIDV